MIGARDVRAFHLSLLGRSNESLTPWSTALRPSPVHAAWDMQAAAAAPAPAPSPAAPAATPRPPSARKKGVRKSCPTCSHSWVDYWRKDECPKCLSSLSRPFKRQLGEASTNKQPPFSAMESESGVCPKSKDLSGLKWRNAGTNRPSGRLIELTEPELAEGLRRKTATAALKSAAAENQGFEIEFTSDEWKAFDIMNLREEHFIASGEFYFQPVVGGPHKWKWGQCTQCNQGQGEEAKEAARAKARQSVSAHADMGGHEYADEAALVLVPAAREKKECPTCGFHWRDCYGRSECPKCLCPLGGKQRRRPGESSTFRQSPLSAMESESGRCPATERGQGPHKWKWGRCVLCNRGEGEEAKEKQARAPSECGRGGRHVYKFGRCVKCNLLADLRIKAGKGAENTVEPSQPQREDPVWKTCPTCTFNWFDSYGKNECPKCLNPLQPEEDLERESPGRKAPSERKAPSAFVRIDANSFPGVAHVATHEAVASHLRPQSARNPGGYPSPRRAASARPPSARASSFHPGFTTEGRKFAVAVDFWERQPVGRDASSPSSPRWREPLEDATPEPSPIVRLPPPPQSQLATRGLDPQTLRALLSEVSGVR